MNMLKLKGKYYLELIRGGKVIATREALNGITDLGINAILDIMMHGTTQITAWFLGLIDASGYTGLSPSDTMASHAGWTEFTTYSEGTRQAWLEDAASGQSITNTTLADFSITGAGTLKGAFLPSDSAKGGSAGTLWSTALFSGGDLAVTNGDTVRLKYTLNASG